MVSRSKNKLNAEESKILQAAVEKVMITFRMGETPAYFYIRKIAMDNKETRVAVARRILSYEGLLDVKPR